MKVSILAFDGCAAISSLGTYDLLKKANTFYQMSNPENREDIFDVELVGVNSKSVPEVGGVSIQTTTTITSIKRTDLVIIPAVDDRVEAAIENNRKCLSWIKNMYKNGADIASICTGCFILAETGLLDNRSATTHWIMQDEFTARYPAVDLKIQSIIVDEGRLCSSGGATSFINLVLHLIEKHCSRDLAVLCSKIFLADANKGSQNNYAIFRPQKNHDDEDILKVQNYIEKNLAHTLDTVKLSSVVAQSKRTFIRRFKKATGNTPLEYVQRVRVEAAKKELESSSNNIAEIIHSVGYEDYSSFRKIFQRYTGFPMSKYRSRYRMDRNSDTFVVTGNS